jgi:hypothetical protein
MWLRLLQAKDVARSLLQRGTMRRANRRDAVTPLGPKHPKEDGLASNECRPDRGPGARSYTGRTAARVSPLKGVHGPPTLRRSEAEDSDF